MLVIHMHWHYFSLELARFLWWLANLTFLLLIFFEFFPRLLECITTCTLEIKLCEKPLNSVESNFVSVFFLHIHELNGLSIFYSLSITPPRSFHYTRTLAIYTANPQQNQAPEMQNRVPVCLKLKIIDNQACRKT